MRANDVLALVRAHLASDHDRFRSIMLVMAAHAPAKTAQDLRKLAERVPTVPRLIALPANVQGLLAHVETQVTLADMVLEPRIEDSLGRVLLEHASREKLQGYGLEPARKLLFVGPPGVGKTMAASAIASGLELPLFRVELHGVIASHLGETAAHLGKVFQQIAARVGVYLFDEFDALSAARVAGGGSDHAEMRRVVNTLLQLIEDDRSASVIIAATNHVDLLDRAMFRRFDARVDFPLPSLDIAERLVRDELLWEAGIDWEALRPVMIGRGHHDLVTACRRVNKEAVLAGRELISTEDLVAAIRDRDPARAEVVA